MRNKSKLVFVFLCVVFSSIVYWYFYNKPVTGIDDANIYFVYMKNFALGHGFVYNAGGEKVEGFTSLIWCLIGALFYKITPTHYPLLLISLNIAAITYALYKLLLLVNKHLGIDAKVSMPDIFVLGSLFLIPGFYEWNIFALLETGLWTSLLILAAIHILELPSRKPSLVYNLKFAVILALMVVTRPEAYAWGAILLAINILYILCYAGNKVKESFQLLLPLLVFIGTMGCLFTWRISYFGFPFPNTYYAKVSARLIDNVYQGLPYLIEFLFSTNPLALAALLFSIYFLLKQLRFVITSKSLPAIHDVPMIFACGIVLIAIILPVGTGGDPFALNRFYQPIVPLLLLIIVRSTYYYLIDKNGLAKPITLAALFFVFSFMPLTDLWHAGHLSRFSLFSKPTQMPLQYQFNIVDENRLFAEKLNLFFDKNDAYPSQGVLAAGAIAYSYKGKCIDMLGLNNVAMAHANKVKATDGLKSHASFNKDVFYEQKPDMMYYSKGFITDTANFKDKFYNLSEFGKVNFMRTALKNVIEDDKFKQLYKPVIISKKGNDEFLYVFASNAFIAKLDSTNYSTKEIEK